MDTNPQHFPTLIIVCVLLSILLYFAALVLSLCYRRQITKTPQHPISTSVPVVSHPNEEEQQIESFLFETEQENQ